MNNIDIEVMSIMECIFISSKAASNQSKFHCKHICWMDKEIQNQEKKTKLEATTFHSITHLESFCMYALSEFFR